MENILALVAATTVLILIPGPNVALIVANSLRYGLWPGIITSMGTTAGIALQLVLVVAGMTTLVETAASALVWIKWIGVAYLIYLGIKTWREPVDDLDAVKAQFGARLFGRALLLAVINPKTLLFNAAFLPQFIGSGSSFGSELVVLTAVFLAVIVVGDALWAVFAASAKHWFDSYGSLRNKLTGGFLFGAGLGLAMSRKTI